ncbi:MAG: amidohydrolase family protein, partial [Bryobacteraceae bacterium]
MKSILLRGAALLDGTGAPATNGDVLVIGDRIAEFGRFEAPADAEVVDCRGLTIAPGFIDAHSHSDLQVLERRPEKILQGVTSEVVGNCGFSPYPAAGDAAALHEFANGIFHGGGGWGWPSARAYLEDTSKGSGYTHAASLAGHGSLRIAQVGHRLGALAASELDALAGSLDQSLDGGACGFSTGLMYSPGASAPFEELERLCSVVARHGKIYATHMRSYSSGLLDAIDEQIALARRTGCRLQISHLQAVGKKNWPMQERALERIEQARDAGLDIAFDCYPYIYGSTVLTQLLPQWALGGGTDGLLARLADARERAKIAAETLAAFEYAWTDLSISAVHSPENAGLVGLSVASIAQLRSREPIEVVLELLAEERGAVNILERNQSEENLRQTLTHPLSVVISDGFYVNGRPHPRLSGTFPFLLGHVVRRFGWLNLAEAVRKITDAPARRFGFTHRGRLARGYFADLTVFDADAIDSPA